jgi:hypothetical protein
VKTKSSWRPNFALSISIAESATGTRETIPPESYEVADLPLAYTEARSGLGYVQKCTLGAGYIHQSFLALPGGFLPRAFENKNCVEIEMETAWRVILPPEWNLWASEKLFGQYELTRCRVATNITEIGHGNDFDRRGSHLVAWGRRLLWARSLVLISAASNMRAEQNEELRRLKEELPLAIKRAAEAFREDPTRSSQNSAVFRKAQLADEKVNAIKRRIADIEIEK